MFPDDMFNDAMDMVSAEKALEWNDNTRLNLFGEFLSLRAPQMFSQWLEYLQDRAQQELDDYGV